MIKIANLNILQWNCRSIRANKESLEALLSYHNITIAILSETWLKKDSYFSCKGFQMIRSDRVNGYSGAAILIKNNINFVTHNTQFPNASNLCLPNIVHISIPSFYPEPLNIISLLFLQVITFKTSPLMHLPVLFLIPLLFVVIGMLVHRSGAVQITTVMIPYLRVLPSIIMLFSSMIALLLSSVIRPLLALSIFLSLLLMLVFVSIGKLWMVPSVVIIFQL